jgi:hypothetical protein
MINPSPKANTGQKRTVEEAIPIPTLGQVAEQERFAPLKDLISSVAATPLNELNKESKDALTTLAGEKHKFLMIFFLAACDAFVEDAATKRAHVTHESRLPGEEQ